MFDFWENAGKWSWNFQLWAYDPVCFLRKQSKRKWKEKKKNEGYVALDFFLSLCWRGNTCGNLCGKKIIFYFDQ